MAAPIVFYVPGLYSSTLQKSSGCVPGGEWKMPHSLLRSLVTGNHGHSNLSLPITWTKDDNGVYVQDKDDIYADGCLRAVQSKLLNVLETLHRNGMIELHTIPWDWRRSFDEGEKCVSDKIMTVCQKMASGKRVIIMSHSTGAMLVWPIINKHPELFSAWINAAGCQQLTGNLFLREFSHGWDISYVRCLSKEVYFTFTGLYSYFQLPGEKWGGDGDSDLVDKNGNFVDRNDVDIYAVSTWEKYKLGIYGWKEGNGGCVTPEERQHLSHALAAAKRYREKTFFQGGKQYGTSLLDKDRSEYNNIRIICYGSIASQAHCGYEIDLDTHTMDVRESKCTTSGDGTLYAENWMNVPGDLDVEIVMAQEGSTHVTLVEDEKLHKLMIETFFQSDELAKVSASKLLGL